MSPTLNQPPTPDSPERPGGGQPPPGTPPPTPTRGRHGLARAAGVISGATFLSRLLGLIREQVFASQFGAGFAVDAFQVAFRIPNLLRDLFAEGAMSAAFVPTLTRVEERDGREAAMRLANLVVNFLLVAVSALCIAGVLAAPYLVRLLAPGFAEVPGKLELTTQMTRIMMPFLLLVSLAAAVMGILNTRRIFFIPALAPTMLNLGLIAAGFFLAPLCPGFGLEPIVGMAFGALLGGLGQLLIQVPSARREGYRWHPAVSFRDPNVVRMVTLMAPAAVGLAAVQVNIFVSTFLASLLAEGSISWLNYAYRLMQLPIGLFGVAVATVTLAEVSRHAAQKNMAGLKETLSSSLRLAFLLTLPATLILIALARPIIALLYQHGKFDAADTAETARALWAYAVGLSAFSAVRVIVPVFYSLGLSRIPVTVSFFTIGATVIFNFVLMIPLRHAGLALATSLGSVLNFALLYWMLRSRVGPMGGRSLAVAVGKILLAGAVAAGAAWVAAGAVERAVGLDSLLERAASVGAGLVAGGAIYLAVAALLGLSEVRSLLRRFAPPVT